MRAWARRRPLRYHRTDIRRKSKRGYEHEKYGDKTRSFDRSGAPGSGAFRGGECESCCWTLEKRGAYENGSDPHLGREWEAHGQGGEASQERCRRHDVEMRQMPG